ncbi:MAG: class F sortase [Frankiaceae bacterium]|jgi:hypothetical protein|nr:class F sortase [Frankiaceae bacterium]
MSLGAPPRPTASDKYGKYAGGHRLPRAGRGRRGNLRRPRRGGAVFLVVALLAAAAAGVAGWEALTMPRTVYAQDAAGGPALRDMTGKLVRIDPGETLSADQRQAQQAQPSGQGRFVVPAVNLDVPLGSMNVVDNQVVPPSFTSAYWIANLGVALADAASGTAFVAVHSVQWGALAPGNYLFDVNSATSAVPRGSAMTVGGVSYTVDGWYTVPKSQLAYDQDVWAESPGKLVIITCLEKPDGSPAVDNFVITAHLSD